MVTSTKEPPTDVGDSNVLEVQGHGQRKTNKPKSHLRDNDVVRNISCVIKGSGKVTTTWNVFTRDFETHAHAAIEVK
jgi:hypothetical protein